MRHFTSIVGGARLCHPFALVPSMDQNKQLDAPAHKIPDHCMVETAAAGLSAPRCQGGKAAAILLGNCLPIARRAASVY